MGLLDADVYAFCSCGLVVTHRKMPRLERASRDYRIQHNVVASCREITVLAITTTVTATKAFVTTTRNNTSLFFNRHRCICSSNSNNANGKIANIIF